MRSISVVGSVLPSLTALFVVVLGLRFKLTSEGQMSLIEEETLSSRGKNSFRMYVQHCTTSRVIVRQFACCV